MKTYTKVLQSSESSYHIVHKDFSLYAKYLERKKSGPSVMPARRFLNPTLCLFRDGVTMLLYFQTIEAATILLPFLFFFPFFSISYNNKFIFLPSGPSIRRSLDFQPDFYYHFLVWSALFLF